MYPKIKVRKQEEDEESSPPNDHVSTPSLRVKSESPSVEGCGSHASEEENQSDSSPSMARFAKPYFVRNLKARPFSASKGKLKDNRRIGENRKLSFGAKSALRPRAVLSSPDNDGIIGKRNKWKNERTLTLKSCNSELTKPAETKVIANQGKSESPLIIRKCFKVGQCASSNTGALKQKGLSKISSPV
ncbi:hypothetical protein BDE02_14G161900 [Populus trichocarpa]|nr:hypothetical protein BDE02_14G161900 [Populus trichocarpa]KAI5566064.1 hypothetical protein BDE02_14G161900 [Populus trichocarpa]